MNVLFVCTGNTCRSPMAEHLLRTMASAAGVKDLKVESAGTSPALDLALPEEAIEALRAEGVRGPVHHPKGLNEATVASADLILAMEAHHRDLVLKRFPAVMGRVHVLKAYAGLPAPWGVADPYGGSAADYRTALTDIKTALTLIVQKWKG